MQYAPTSVWLSSLALALCGLAACVSPPDYPEEPVITYEGISKDSIFQFTNGPADSLVVHFSFTDGDGDISTEDSTDIFLRDSRFPDLPPTVVGAFPPIPSGGTSNGISGDVFFTIINSGQGICCIFNNTFCAEDERLPVDTFHYEIYIVDRAGNQSNTIRTETIAIDCLGR